MPSKKRTGAKEPLWVALENENHGVAPDHGQGEPASQLVFA